METDWGASAPENGDGLDAQPANGNYLERAKGYPSDEEILGMEAIFSPMRT